LYIIEYLSKWYLNIVLVDIPISHLKVLISR